MIQKKTISGRIFDIFNYLFMIFMIAVTFYPLYYVLVRSFSNGAALVGSRGLMLWPKGFNLEAYKAVFANPNILSGYRNTLFIVVIGTTLNVIMTSLAAFLITRKNFAIKSALAYMMIFTMYFSGGLIPNYLLVSNVLHMGDSLSALIFPTAISAYNVLIMRANFAGIPDSLEESARLDGANELLILFRIILPLSIPIIAVMVLFYGVAHWNSWFNAMIYLREREKYPLQLILREILLMDSSDNMATSASGGAERFMLGESIRSATIIVATVPILLVYPFIQRYFVTGIMIGAVKG